MISLLVEKTGNYLAFFISGKSGDAVITAMRMLKDEKYGDRFAQVFRTVTAGNGSKFEAFVPKRASTENCSAEYILTAADELNARCHKMPGYCTPEKLLDAFRDYIYAAGSKLACPSIHQLRLACGILYRTGRACCAVDRLDLH